MVPGSTLMYGSSFIMVKMCIRDRHILAGDLANPAEFLCDPRLEQVTHVLNCAAVAYTHLDVYKRQGASGAGYGYRSVEQTGRRFLRPFRR